MGLTGGARRSLAAPPIEIHIGKCFAVSHLRMMGQCRDTRMKIGYYISSVEAELTLQVVVIRKRISCVEI